MNAMKVQSIAVIGALAAAAIAALYIAKKGVAGAAAGAVGAAADAATGTVIGIGQVFGIPETSMSDCDKARAEGRTWDASFACPAATFIGHLWDTVTGSGGGTATNALQGAQDKFQRPNPASSAPPAPAPLSFIGAGQSFKDLADGAGINVFWNPATYGGGFDLH